MDTEKKAIRQRTASAARLTFAKFAFNNMFLIYSATATFNDSFWKLLTDHGEIDLPEIIDNEATRKEKFYSHFLIHSFFLKQNEGNLK